MDDLDFPAPTDILAFPPFPLSTFFGAVTLDLWVTLSKDPALLSALDSFFFYLWWTAAKTGNGAGGGGILLSNKLSGTLETASIMVELLYASLPILSRVSKILRDGNIVKT